MTPLEVLGLPKPVVKAIWADDTLSNERKATTLHELAKRVYRALMQTVHSDTASGNFGDLAAEYTMAYQAIEPNYELLNTLVEWYVTDVRAFPGREAMLEGRCIKAETQVVALKRFLPYMDWRQALDLSVPSEVLFGLPWAPDMDARHGYQNTFVLRCGQTEQTLFELRHPFTDDPIVPTPYDFNGVPEWHCDAWWANSVVGMHRYVEEPQPYGKVVLVGHVPYEFFESSPKPQTPGIGLPASDQAEAYMGLVWQGEPLWLGHLRPGAEGGNVVVAKPAGEGFLLALVGTLLASRPL